LPRHQAGTATQVLQDPGQPAEGFVLHPLR
jgi:hypothetical protein